ncbi:ATP-dependent DNA helicase RecQ-like [Haliotis rufescens]|uniref:ATP-dependent DNA helicase RecQ-like n=1 Tax=Haliotis rufescens TaxID=6454 RepID=UPI00201F8626|nr:ATP-dependent DNA helicase RecQ-like [Haliotis rufescens]
MSQSDNPEGQRVVSRTPLKVRDDGKCNTGVKNIRNEKAFRPAYGTLGELRALAPGIPVIALTATATKSTRDVIINEMCLSGCEQILLCPNKENIKYWQISTSGNIRQDFSWLVALLRERNRQTPRMLIFFRKIKQIGDLFDFLKSELKHDAFINNSDDGVNSHKNRLFDMFHSKTNREVKKCVSQSFMDPNGFKRIILCSTSFSMGLDLQSVETVIHYGPANNVEDYIQETGRAGRDPEKQAHALLMNFRHCLSGRRNISDEMKQYVRTKHAEYQQTCSRRTSNIYCAPCSMQSANRLVRGGRVTFIVLLAACRVPTDLFEEDE